MARAREKSKWTYENAKAERDRVLRKLAGNLIENRHQLGDRTFNTTEVHQDIGRYLALKDVIVE